MNEDESRDAEQENPQQKDYAELSSVDTANTVDEPPNSAHDDKKRPHRTQQEDDKDGYPRDWYSPNHPGVQKDWALRRTHEYSALVNIMIGSAAFFVILWQGWIYVEQTRLMEKQWTEMRDTREVENRAWVGVKPIHYSIEPDGVSIMTTYINTGNVPATAALIMNGECLNESPPNDRSYTHPASPPSQFILMPGGEITDRLVRFKSFPFCGSRPPSQKTLPGNMASPLRRANQSPYFYLFGKIDYTDTFGSHETKFCFFSLPSVLEQPPVFAVCPTHNTFK